ncbi:MAG: hypothetical protein ACM359_11235 [Bacillota bacterium]
MRYLPLIAVAICLSALSALAQDTSALINKALDEQVKLTLNNTLPDAMDAIWRQTGVRLEAQPIVWELLPWGRDTNVSATIENHTLREALTLITRKLGLTLVLRDQFIEIQPMPGLKRLGQRATVLELRALDLLASTPLNPKADRMTIRQLLETVDLRLAALTKDPDIAIENRLGDAIDSNRMVFIPRNASLMEALESLPKETKATWYPWGKSILIVTKQDRTRALLEKPITLSTGDQGKDLLQLLTEISNATGVPFEYQPGVMQVVPAEARMVRGVIENVPAQQVLAKISASTGLSYTIQDERVQISAANAPAAANPAPAAPRDPVIGIIQLDSGIQVLVPASQVPPDVREYLRYKTQKQLGKIREMMEDENFKPGATTQPTENEGP